MIVPLVIGTVEGAGLAAGTISTRTGLAAGTVSARAGLAVEHSCGA
jgi:hypothetical protein